MLLSRSLIAMFVFLLAVHTGASPLKAADCEDTLSRHMVGEALLVAHFVALAEKTGMTPDAINTILKSISENSAIQEFWITDTVGHAIRAVRPAGVDSKTKTDKDDGSHTKDLQKIGRFVARAKSQQQ
jgi:hypothetical protein